jgi:hypothetical protein
MQKTFTPKTEKLYSHGSIGPLILKDYLGLPRRTMAAGTDVVPATIVLQISVKGFLVWG